VTQEDFSLEREVFGRATASQMTPVMAPAPGEVSELHVANSEEVEEDADIAVLTTAQGDVTIPAPADGVIANLEASEGEMVSNEDPFALVMDLEELNVEFSVTAAVRDIFSLNDTYTVTQGGTEYDATITQIESLPDDTGLYPVTAEIENPNTTILPGMVVQLNAIEEVIEDALIVPSSAVVQENNESFVYVIDNDIAHQREVEVLAMDSDTTVIEGDLTAGDEVVTSGQLTLSDGDQVDVQKGE
jgi:RND family efflux transporter MFP subunit